MREVEKSTYQGYKICILTCSLIHEMFSGLSKQFIYVLLHHCSYKNNGKKAYKYKPWLQLSVKFSSIALFKKV